MGAAERSETSAGGPKDNPGTLALRGRPRPVIRFRRGLIIAMTAAAGSVLVALAWAALQPASLTVAGHGAVEGAAGPSPEAIAGAPASYADVPQLGPQLPGDLGRAIVERERGRGGAGDLQADAGSAATARQSLAAERQAARESPLLVRLSRTAVPEPRSRPATSEADERPIGGSASSIGRPAQRRLLPDDDAARRAVLTPARSPWMLAAGTVIPASLLTGLNSDLPGMVVAQVTHNVRDTVTGGTILIPQGARLIGDYDSHVAFGQQRLLLVWKRILFPDGSSVDLGAMPATDAAGHSGVEDKVDFHEWRLVKGVLLSSLLGVGSELGYGGDDRDLVRAVRESAQSNGSRAGEAIVSRNLDVRPTLTVRPGWPVRAVLHKDLVLEPWRGW